MDELAVLLLLPARCRDEHALRAEQAGDRDVPSGANEASGVLVRALPVSECACWMASAIRYELHGLSCITAFCHRK